MQGDILFYVYKGGLFETFIKDFTHSDFVHVEIDIGDGWAVGAVKDGIMKHALATTTYRWVFAEHVQDMTVLPNAIEWLCEQVGLQYGLEDIVSAGLSLFEKNFYIGEQGHYDCSDLATRFLVEAGAISCLGALAQEPHMVTPAMLALQLGIHP